MTENQKPNLEELSGKAIEEANRLFCRDDCAITARFVIEDAISKYKSADQEVPEELTIYQKKLDRSVRNLYPIRIEEALKRSDNKKAMGLFYVLKHYMHPRGITLPEFEYLEEAIAKVVPDYSAD